MPFNICRISIFSAISIWLDHTVTKLYLLYAVEALSIAPGLVAEGKVLKNGKELSFAGKSARKTSVPVSKFIFSLNSGVQAGKLV